MSEVKDKPSTTEKREESEKKAATAADIEKLKEDPRFDLPTTTITTSEDAYQAYLREEIDESELRAVVAANGGSPFAALKANLERPDNAYKRQVPEDMYDDVSLAVSNVDDRLKDIEDRDKKAKAAQDASDKTEKEFNPAQQALDPSVQANLKNRAAEKAVEDDKSDK